MTARRFADLEEEVFPGDEVRDRFGDLDLEEQRAAGLCRVVCRRGDREVGGGAARHRRALDRVERRRVEDEETFAEGGGLEVEGQWRAGRQVVVVVGDGDI